jgi:hypothetical protein
MKGLWQYCVSTGVVSQITSSMVLRIPRQWGGASRPRARTARSAAPYRPGSRRPFPLYSRPHRGFRLSDRRYSVTAFA